LILLIQIVQVQTLRDFHVPAFLQFTGRCNQ
jgi:hypothetical protein